MRWNLRLTRKGQTQADVALGAERFEDPTADLLWYIESEGFSFVTEGDDPPEVSLAYAEFKSEYDMYAGCGTPTTIEHFADAIKEGLLEWRRWNDFTFAQHKLEEVRRIVKRVVGPDNDADYTEVEAALEDLAKLLDIEG